MHPMQRAHQELGGSQMAKKGYRARIRSDRSIWQIIFLYGPISDLRDTDLNMPSDAATIKRLIKSSHLSDLRLATGLVFWALIISVSIAAFYYHHHIVKNLSIIGSLIGAAAIAMGWIYRTASNRLGTVDLFAYEITTLCRVGTIVNAIDRYIKLFNHHNYEIGHDLSQDHNPLNASPASSAVRPANIRRFTSGENYFPIFERNSSDLRSLEAGAVTNVTAFFTYMKVARDYLRRLGDLDSSNANMMLKIELQHSSINLIYILFLAYESARNAIADLIEYEPTRAEVTIVILLSELSAYGFLIEYFRDDSMWQRRLHLRAHDYVEDLKDLHGRVFDPLNNCSSETRDWSKARQLWDELYDRARKAKLEVRSRP
jgi:hypothetical protein